MDKETKGAWVIHHGRKVSGDQRGASEYSAIDLAAKTASLLVRLAESKQADLNKSQVVAAARIGGLNPKTELQACLTQLQDRRVIDVAADGSVSVIGVTGRTALGHASDLFDENEPQPFELASIGLAELASVAPVGAKAASEYIGDTYKLTKSDTSDFLSQAYGIGFVDAARPSCRGRQTRSNGSVATTSPPMTRRHRTEPPPIGSSRPKQPP
jgi:hypothetical protein